jgi:hypothetical protein
VEIVGLELLPVVEALGGDDVEGVLALRRIAWVEIGRASCRARVLAMV